jgi:hypothetical protein
MANSSEADNTPLPGSVFTPKQVRLLKFVVIGLGVVLVGGFLAVVLGIAYEASHPSKVARVQAAAVPVAADTGPSFDVAVPEGAQVVSTSLDGERLALTLKTQSGPEIVVIDLRRRKVVSRIMLK